MLIDQAIFTSAPGGDADGYRLVASSAGISPDEAHELAAWGPSHDSLWEISGTASVNFHPLASGRYCVARTSAAGAEFSRRGGQRIYTQNLVVPAEILARFANNPFALLRAAMAQGSLCVHDKVPDRLDAIRLAGRSSEVDTTALSDLSIDPGFDRFTAMLDAVLTSPRVALAADRGRQTIIAGIVNCLPIAHRVRFSFSTGLRPSPRRPFALIGLPDDAGEVRRMRRQHEMVVVSASDAARRPIAHPWARFVATVLRAGKVAALANHFHALPPEAGDMELARLGEMMLGRAEGRAARPMATRPRGSEAATFPRLVLPEGDGDARRSPAPGAATAPMGSTARAATAVAPAPTAPEPLASGRHDLFELVERLDDLVFEVIAGKAAALPDLKVAWHECQARLAPELVAESKEQYIRQALAAWRETGQRDPAQAVSAIEMMCLLFGP